MEETTYYTDSTIRVTSEGVYLRDGMFPRDGTLYTFDAIRSIETHAYSTSRQAWRLPIYFMLGSIALLIVYLSIPTEPPFLRSCGWTVFFLGAVGAAGFFCYLLLRTLRDERSDVYVVTLHGSFGYANIAATLDRGEAEQLAQVVERARDGLRVPAIPSILPTHREHQRAAYFADDAVSVDRDSVRLKEKVYSISHIKRASNVALQIDRKADIADGAGLALILALFIFMVLTYVYGIRVSNWVIHPVYIYFVLRLVISGFKSRRRFPNVYLLKLRTGGSWINAFASINNSYLLAIVWAINAAQREKDAIQRRAANRLT